MTGALVVGLWLWPGEHDVAAEGCRELVESRLRSPSTVEWGDWYATEAGDQVLVVGELDAQNGFGATVRSRYRCEHRLSDGSVRVLDITTR